MITRFPNATAKCNMPVSLPRTNEDKSMSPALTRSGTPAETAKPAWRAGSRAVVSFGPPPKRTCTPRRRQWCATCRWRFKGQSFCGELVKGWMKRIGRRGSRWLALRKDEASLRALSGTRNSLRIDPIIGIPHARKSWRCASAGWIELSRGTDRV